jgi:Glycosyltransferase WbsX
VDKVGNSSDSILRGRNAIRSSEVSGIEGRIEKLTRREAIGWAWMPSLPDRPVEVEAVLDDQVIGRTTANLPCPDLLAINNGNGRCGFSVIFAKPLIGDRAPIVRAFVAVDLFLTETAAVPTLTLNHTNSGARGTINMLLEDHVRFTTSGPDFEEFDPSILGNVSRPNTDSCPLLVAFYLPQFHPTPENNQFWGRGFTEWRQLPRALPRFPGHYQPRIPRDLGFYNLSSIDAIQAQVNMAKAAGIGGFAFYYYWFDRRRILDTPLQLLLGADLDMPFILIWANENWTRAWDGSTEVLLEQNYRSEDEEFLLEDISRHLVDRRYIRINGQPLFVIYNPKNIPDAPSTISRWRSVLTRKCGVTPLLFMAQTYGEVDPRPYGLDGALEFPPHKLIDRVPVRAMPSSYSIDFAKVTSRAMLDAYSNTFAGLVAAYDDIVTASLQEGEPDFPLIKTAIPSWDNEPRRPNRGFTLDGLSPKKYEAWVKTLILRATASPILGTPIVAINAWNEWAEGAYLEPDVYYGASFLNATARAYVSATR